MAANRKGASAADNESRPYVVGIGASAGGIEALSDFFRAVPPDSGAAYVVILHLSPDHDSMLAEMLQHTAMIPVMQVTERFRIETDHAYVVPPNKFLRIEGDSIVVEEMAGQEERRAPVDLFFRSLADAHGARAACVVLSGTGPNGSSGLKRVKEYGGLVIAQDPEKREVRRHAAQLDCHRAGRFRAARRRDPGAHSRVPRAPAADGEEISPSGAAAKATPCARS